MSDLPFRVTMNGLPVITKDTLGYIEHLLARELDTPLDIHLRLSLLRTEQPNLVAHLYDKVKGLPLGDRINLLEGALFAYEALQQQQRSNIFFEEFVSPYSD